jgi:uncharacterized secreted protein with C-terminal beta-propeller domain
MSNLPQVIATSVIRSSFQGESHGGIYLIDLQNETSKKVYDWNNYQIDWSGRGFDRGLRGIAFYGKKICLASSDEIFIFDQNFNIVGSIRNNFLKHCHEIYIQNKILYLTSTGHDSILVYSLEKKRFIAGFNLFYPGLDQKLSNTRIGVKPSLKIFDPNGDDGPIRKDTFHINNVFVDEKNTIYISGTRLGAIYKIEDQSNTLKKHCTIPFYTHNAQPYKDRIILNNTSLNKVIYMSKNNHVLRQYSIKLYPENDLLMKDIPKDHARQGFARGLCTFENLLIGGSSPATISVYDLDESDKRIKTINISLDVRNAIHGLEIWPY